jgi:lysophospholipid acyltransferase (LPLAT)-like uncharacterized protein
MAETQDGLWRRIRDGVVFWILWLIVTAVLATVRFRVEGEENLREIVESGKGGLIVLWHGVTLLPIYYCRHRGFYSIVSVSRDGELQNKMLRSRGFRTIRGSSARHAVRALLESVRCIKAGGIMALTPDGPKGPSKIVQPGTVHLAQSSGCPVLPVGVACKPCKRLSSWDKHLVPMPFARAVITFGDSLYVSVSDDLQSAAARIGEAIEAQERRAEEILG